MVDRFIMSIIFSYVQCGMLLHKMEKKIPFPA